MYVSVLTVIRNTAMVEMLTSISFPAKYLNPEQYFFLIQKESTFSLRGKTIMTAVFKMY